MKAKQLLQSGSFLDCKRALEKKEISSVELTQACLDRADEINPKINCYTQIFHKDALKEAEAADLRIKNGESSPILGIPTSVKDLILVKGHRTTAASRILENFKAPYDASVVTKLKEAGSPILGKLNLDEFAMGSSNESSFFGTVKNPWDTKKVPGGSSGGSAAALAARSCLLALGSDTGGSVRQPASLCGVTGLKPTYGRLSRFGMIAFASSLDQVGPMGIDAPSAAALLDAIGGHDPKDATSSSKKTNASLPDINSLSNLKGKRLGLIKEFSTIQCQSDVEQRFEETKDFFLKQGASVEEISISQMDLSLATYYIICASEASSNLARYDGIHYGYRHKEKSLRLEDLYSTSRSEGFGPEVQLRILLGTYCLSSGYYDAFYEKAAKIRRLIYNDFEKAFANVDLLISPTSASEAFNIGDKAGNPLAMYECDLFTIAANLAGLSALSTPMGFSKNKLPLGLQIMAPRWKDDQALQLAHFYEKAHPEHLKAAPL